MTPLSALCLSSMCPSLSQVIQLVSGTKKIFRLWYLLNISKYRVFFILSGSSCKQTTYLSLLYSLIQHFSEIVNELDCVMLDTSTKNNVIKKKEDNEKLYLIDLETDERKDDGGMDTKTKNSKMSCKQRNSVLFGNDLSLSLNFRTNIKKYFLDKNPLKLSQTSEQNNENNEKKIILKGKSIFKITDIHLAQYIMINKRII